MSISLEQLTQILAKIKISSFLEEEILIVAKYVITPPDTNMEELTFEEWCISDEEHLFELDIERGEEEISGDQNHEEYQVNESYIKQWFQVSIRLDQFCFCFYFVNLHLQYLISHTFEYIRFHLLLLHVWFHWKFHYT